MWLRTLLASAIAVALSGCTSEPITQTPFQRAAGDAASVMSAAAYTITFLHEHPPRLTVEYGRASVINYLDLVSDVPEELPALEGAPDDSTIDSLAGQLDAAISDLENACLLPDCDWQSQVTRMQAVAQALTQAAE